VPRAQPSGRDGAAAAVRLTTDSPSSGGVDQLGQAPSLHHRGQAPQKGTTMHTTSQGNPFRSVLTDDQRAVLDGIMARAHARFGFDAFRMEGDGDGGSGDGGDGGDQGGSDAGGDAGNDAGQSDDQGAAEGKVEDLPDWAQKIIRDTRADAGKARNDAKQKAADDARAELAQTIGKALGLVKDGDKEKVDPVELTRQLTDSRAETRETKAELVVWRNAADLKVDAQALTDSKAFANATKDLDPSSETFEADVKKAAQAAVKQNPKLAASQAAGSSSADHAGGSGQDGAPRKPKSMADAVASTLGT
jgi:hypothetical protein